MPEISVVIPSYNHAAFIAEAVKSVLDQTFQDLELIVVDDGSSDNSLEVLGGFTDPRLVVISQANQGAHAAINRGLKHGGGDFLAILNSDDAYHPRRLELILNALKARPGSGLAGTYIEIVDERGASLGVKHGYLDCPPWLLEHPERSFRAEDDLHAALLTENFWSTTSNFVFSRPLFQQAGEFLPLRYAHDWDFALRLARLAPSILIPEPLIRYRVHASNTIRENQVAMVFEICWMLAVHLPQSAADLGLFDPETADQSLDRLLHSIYVFGMDRVLSAMLLQRLSDNPTIARRLLDNEDPMRSRYLEYIRQHLEAPTASNASQPERQDLVGTPGWLKASLSRLKRRMGSIAPAKK